MHRVPQLLQAVGRGSLPPRDLYQGPGLSPGSALDPEGESVRQSILIQFPLIPSVLSVDVC